MRLNSRTSICLALHECSFRPSKCTTLQMVIIMTSPSFQTNLKVQRFIYHIISRRISVATTKHQAPMVGGFEYFFSTLQKKLYSPLQNVIFASQANWYFSKKDCRAFHKQSFLKCIKLEFKILKSIFGQTLQNISV